MALATVLDAKRVTKDFLESEIADVKYQRLGGTLTHCTIYTHDGFTFTGESACVDLDQFDEEIGKQIAYKAGTWQDVYALWFLVAQNFETSNQAEDGKRLMITLAHLQTRFDKDNELAELTDREHSTTIDVDVVNAAIRDAESEAESYSKRHGLDWA